MKVTKSREESMNWEQVGRAISMKELHPGDRIEIGDSEWKILATEDNRILIWKCTGVEDHVFNENGSNVYEGSDIQK